MAAIPIALKVAKLERSLYRANGNNTAAVAAITKALVLS